jgi:acetyl esterase/lipase
MRRIRPIVDDRRPLEQRRTELVRLARLARMPLGVMVEPTTVGGVAGEWLTPLRPRTDEVLLYLHGGAYVMGSCATHRAFVARIARAARCRTLLIDYRLAPEHPFPAALEDALASYRALQATEAQIVLAGDSAGAGLALATMLTLRDAGEALPRKAALISPWADLLYTGDSVISRAAADPWLTPVDNDVARHYCGDQDRRNPLISPLYGEHHGLPPTLIQVGDHEILLDDSTRLAERMQAAGVAVSLQIWPAMWHVWHSFAPLLPEANQAIRRIGKFMREV